MNTPPHPCTPYTLTPQERRSLRALALYVWLDQLGCAPTDRATFLCMASSGGEGVGGEGGSGGEGVGGGGEGGDVWMSKGSVTSGTDHLIAAPFVCRLLQRLMTTTVDHHNQAAARSSPPLALTTAMSLATTPREQWQCVLDFIAQHSSSNTLQSFCRNPRYTPHPFPPLLSLPPSLNFTYSHDTLC